MVAQSVRKPSPPRKRGHGDGDISACATGRARELQITWRLDQEEEGHDGKEPGMTYPQETTPCDLLSLGSLHLLEIP